MRPIHPAAALAPLLLVLAACAGPASPPSPSVEQAASHEASPSVAPAAGDGDTVTISGYAFPGDITVAAGTTVTFVNGDPATHTVSEGTDGQVAADARFDERLAASGSVEITFDEPGTYQVTCTIHPDMNMTVAVEG